MSRAIYNNLSIISNIKQLDTQPWFPGSTKVPAFILHFFYKNLHHLFQNHQSVDHYHTLPLRVNHDGVDVDLLYLLFQINGKP